MKSNVADYTVNNDKIWGIYRGVVEDIHDPELLCRCRVRVLGIHDELKDKDDLNGIPTIELPWAQPCFGLFQGSVSGQGMWSVPLQGSYVFVFFEDGNWMQPRFFLTAPGKPELPPDGKIGFNDPDEEWPDHTGKYSFGKDWLDEADPHRLMKRDFLGPTAMIEVKEPNIRKAVDIAIGGTWNETPPMYATEYPYNNVWHTWGGVYMEMDASPKGKRFHIYHPSNSYIEIGEIGDMTIRNNLNRWDIVIEMRFEETVSDFHRLTRGERTSKVLKNEYEEIIETSYRKIHVNDRKDVMDTQWYHIFVDEKLWVDNLREEYIGLSDFEYVVDKKTSYVGADALRYHDAKFKKYVKDDDLEYLDAKKIKYIKADEERRIDGNRKSHTIGWDIIQAEGELIFRSSEKIIIEAPTIELRGFATDILTDFTEIAAQLTWGGVADGCAESAMKAIVGVPIVYDVEVVPPDPVDPIEIPEKPEKPEVPPEPEEIPAPPAPPAPPAYDYTDKPAEPDDCP